MSAAASDAIVELHRAAATSPHSAAERDAADDIVRSVAARSLSRVDDGAVDDEAVDTAVKLYWELPAARVRTIAAAFGVSPVDLPGLAALSGPVVSRVCRGCGVERSARATSRARLVEWISKPAYDCDGCVAAAREADEQRAAGQRVRRQEAAREQEAQRAKREQERIDEREAIERAELARLEAADREQEAYHAWRKAERARAPVDERSGGWTALPFGGFVSHWNSWRDRELGRAPLPDDFARSFATFVHRGLGADELHDAVRCAMRAPGVAHDDRWAYFCGVCWNKIRPRGARTDTHHVPAVRELPPDWAMSPRDTCDESLRGVVRLAALALSDGELVDLLLAVAADAEDGRLR